MKPSPKLLAAAALVLSATMTTHADSPIGTAFTYQARLMLAGAPLDDSADFMFSLWDAAGGGLQVGDTQSVNSVAVVEGLFTVNVDFGAAAFNGRARWLEIAVRSPAGAGEFTTLSPRQPLKPAPYALALPGLFTQQVAVSPNLIGGYQGNMITSGVIGGTIGGGGNSGGTNEVTDNYGAIGGGSSNQAGDDAGTTNDAQQATVAGGFNNTASGNRSAVGGGLSNTASGTTATVGGGNGNTASGSNATVPGGNSNTAAGSYAFAAGRRAKADHQGAFVWADSTPADFASTANDQFLIRAGGGVGIGTATPGAKLDVVQTDATGGAAQITIDNAANDAVAALSVSNDGAGFGIDVEAGVVAIRATATGADSNGVHGVSLSGSGVGVYGENNTNGEFAYGVKGEITHPTGTGAGVYGTAPFFGVFGEATDVGIGVQGRCLDGDGVVGESASGLGVNGFTSSTNTSISGVRGSGPVAGVRGVASNTSGATYAVFGTTLSSAGYGGYFEGRGHFSGNVGIGVAPPGNRLDVRDASTTANVMNLERESDAASASDLLQMRIAAGSSDTCQFIECERGSDIEFRVFGDGDVTADGTYTSPADFAEMIRVSTGAESVEAGDVMVIDVSESRSVVKSSAPRSTLVAGVYSTRPGVLGSEHDWDDVARGLGLDPLSDTQPQSLKPIALGRRIGEIPMAVVGIVPCKVSAENGAIRAGDLLVTSGTPGHAMRDENPRAGTIVGKALGPLDSGTGVVRVLVALQ